MLLTVLSSVVMVKPAERAVRQHVEHALPVQLDACGALEIPEAKGTKLIGGHTAQSQSRRDAIARQCPTSIVMVIQKMKMHKHVMR